MLPQPPTMPIFNDALPTCCRRHYVNLNEAIHCKTKLNISQRKSNIREKFDGAVLDTYGSLVVPHFLSEAVADQWATACEELKPERRDTIGGQVPQITIVNSPRGIPKLKGARKAMLDKFILPFLESVGVDPKTLLQVIIFG